MNKSERSVTPIPVPKRKKKSMKFSFRDEADNEDNFFEKYAVCGPPTKVHPITTECHNGLANTDEQTNGQENFNSGGQGANPEKADNYDYLLHRLRNKETFQT